MTTLSQTIDHLLIDVENIRIKLSDESLQINQMNIQRSTQPFSDLKNGKFRRLFNRHSIIER
ncbi:hypothetical protein WJR50_14510 [Catalinimonas sp. 4WD22]|uniref:hypothetical protein n=1 Tax=Catalinimonas locisalis TaxID=3133978 RepID=UPI0031018BF1